MRKRKRHERVSIPAACPNTQSDEELSEVSSETQPQQPLPLPNGGSSAKFLSPGKDLVFQGCSVLNVLQGSLKVMGKIVSGGDRSVTLSTLGMDGVGIALTSLGGAEEFPLMDMQCKFELSKKKERTQLHPLFSKKSPPCYLFPELWDKEATKVLKHAQTGSPIVILILGAQGSGKSSFFRFMINSLLNQFTAVGALELDVGQPEFGTPGKMSLAIVDEPLLGGPLTHNVKPSESVFYGASDLQKDPTRYLNSIRHLFGKWQDTHASGTEVKFLPLVVNTCGYTTGLGEVVQLETVKALQPSHIFFLKASDPSKVDSTSLIKGVEKFLSKRRAIRYIRILPSMAQENIHSLLSSRKKATISQYNVPKKAPRKRRMLLFLRWAAECLGQNTDAMKWERNRTIRMTAGKLPALKPWGVSLKSICVECLFGHVQQSDILHILNGAFVGLSIGDENEPKNGSHSKIRNCVGLGLVRSVNIATGHLFVLTDVEACALAKVDIIQVGNLRVPSELSITNLHHPSFLVPRTLVNAVF